MRPTLIAASLLALAGPILLAGETPPPTAETPAAASVLTADELAAIDEVSAALIAAGVPDTRGATLIVGEITVVEPHAKTNQDENQHRSFSSRRVRVSDGKRTSTWRGTHAELADGRILLGLNRLHQPGEGITLTISDQAKRLSPAALAEDLKGRKPRGFTLKSQMEQWLKLFKPEVRDRVMAIVERAEGITRMDGIWMQGLSAFHLHRAGVPGAAEFLAMSGLQQIIATEEGDDDTPFGNAPLLTLDPDGRHAMGWSSRHAAARDPETWMKEREGRFDLPTPGPALRRMAAAWFYERLLDDEELTAAGLSFEQASERFLSFTDQRGRPTATAAVTLLAARHALPKQVPAEADLATRLQHWNPQQHRMFNQDEDEDEDEGPKGMTPEMLAELPEEVRKHLAEQAARRSAWRPREADVAGLLDLLEDGRATRWIDNQHPRTVGDNALRALARIVRFDPRLLIGRDPAEPWTAAERTATATALRTWWAQLAGKPLAEGLAAAIDRLPMAAAARLLASRPEAERPALIDRLVTAWSTAWPAEVAPGDLSQILAVASDHQGLAALVAARPVEGPLRPLLAVWHDRQGRPQALDAVLDGAIATGNDTDQSARLLAAALGQAMRSPTPARLQRVLALVAGPLDDRRTWVALACASQVGNNFWDEEWAAVQQLDRNDGGPRVRNLDGNEKAGDPAHALPLLVMVHLLADRRPMPEGGYTLMAHGHWGQLMVGGMHLGVQLVDMETMRHDRQEQPPERPAPTGLRVCDLAGATGRMLSYQIGLYELKGAHVDLWAAPDVRDRALGVLVGALTEKARDALAAAKLPDVLPAPPAAGGEQSLF